MNIQDAFYHGRIVHLRNVINALGPERLAKGMTAFDDGKSSWSECFFARALEGEAVLNNGYPEQTIKEVLGLKSIVPIRFTWRSFDSAKETGLTRAQLKSLIDQIVVDQHSDEVNKFLASVQFDETVPVEMSCG